MSTYFAACLTWNQRMFSRLNAAISVISSSFLDSIFFGYAHVGLTYATEHYFYHNLLSYYFKLSNKNRWELMHHNINLWKIIVCNIKRLVF